MVPSLVGGVEVVGALGLLVGTVLHWVGMLATIWLAVVM